MDAAVREACTREGRVLITLDSDCSDVRLVDPRRSAGIVVLRPPDQSIAAALSCLDGAVRLLAVELPEGALWIVDLERVRVRRRT